jgi:hypothetical protein
MRRLPIHLSQKVLREGRHEMHIQIYDGGACSLLLVRSSHRLRRMETKRRSTIASPIVSSLSPILAPIGVVIVDICFLLVGRMLASVRSAISLATRTALTLFPTFAACPWRPPTNCFVIGETSTRRVAVKWEPWVVPHILILCPDHHKSRRLPWSIP